MPLLETLQVLHRILERSTSHHLESSDSVIYEVEARDEIDQELNAAGIKHAKIGNSSISIRLSDFRGLFYDDNDFLQQCNSAMFKSDIGILFHVENKYLFYNPSDNQTLICNKVDDLDIFVQNANYYWKFFEAIRSLGITIYHSSASREFVLISPTKGKFLLGYTPTTPRFPNEFDLSIRYDALQSMNQSKEYRSFFKEQIIDSLSLQEHDKVFQALIENIEAIIESSNRNYEVFLNQFNFEELKKNFRKERDEYFSKIREIIDQILSKIVAIPISISASALAIYNLKNELAYAAIVAVAFVVYSLFNAFLLRLLHIDVLGIRRELEDDLKIIGESSNIPSDILKDEASKVYQKISTLETTINVLEGILAILTVAVLAVFLRYTNLPSIFRVVILFLVLVPHIGVSWFRLLNKTNAPSHG